MAVRVLAKAAPPCGGLESAAMTRMSWGVAASAPVVRDTRSEAWMATNNVRRVTLQAQWGRRGGGSGCALSCAVHARPIGAHRVSPSEVPLLMMCDAAMPLPNAHHSSGLYSAADTATNTCDVRFSPAAVKHSHLHRGGRERGRRVRMVM